MHGWLDSLPGMAWGGFSAPAWFGLLGLVAAVVGGYVWARRRARRYTMRFANLEVLERAAPRRADRAGRGTSPRRCSYSP